MSIFNEILEPEQLNENELIRLEALLSVILNLCQTLEKTILDIGCGDGRISIALAKEGYNVIGIDSSEEMLTEMKGLVKKTGLSKHFINFYKQDATELNYPDNYFNIVICSEMLEYIKDNTDLQKVINEMKRVCNDDGYIVITVPYKNKVKGTKGFPHYRIFVESDLKKMFGFVKFFEIPTDRKKWIGIVVKNENS